MDAKTGSQLHINVAGKETFENLRYHVMN